MLACSTSEGERAVFAYDLEARRTTGATNWAACRWTYDAQHQVIECIDLDGAR